MSKKESLNPLKRVNSILTEGLVFNPIIGNEVSIPSSGSIQFLQNWYEIILNEEEEWSQSPQAGQFNSYNGKEGNCKKGE